MGYAQSVQRLAEPPGFVRRNVSGRPLVVVFRKQLDAVATAPVGTLHRFVVSAGNRLVGAENGHVATVAEASEADKSEGDACRSGSSDRGAQNVRLQFPAIVV